jgi:hypothetical protein
VAYTVQFKPLALQQLEKLPRDIQKKLAGKIEALRDDPFPSAARRWLQCPMPGACGLGTTASFIRFIRKSCWCLCSQWGTGKTYIGDFEGAAINADVFAEAED